MFLYNLTLQKPTCITHAVQGNFSGTKQQEIAISRGRILELIRPDQNTGKVHTLLSVEIFGIIRSMMSFRLTGGSKDYLVLGSDSGRIVILEYMPQKNIFERVHQETFGKSGCRRIVPGQYLAIDPKGRAVMIGAVEKQKLVYILNRDASARLTISSPLEAHKSNTIVYHMVGVDVGFENPMFACLEMDYDEADNDPTGEAAQQTQQTLTFYELDLGLNHVVRKHSEPLEEHGNFLMTVPGGTDGPSGVLICSENYITYKNIGDQHDIRCPIPRRRNDLDDPERGMIFVCSATHKTKTMFFFLVQTEQGDIFKITLETDEDMVRVLAVSNLQTSERMIHSVEVQRCRNVASEWSCVFDKVTEIKLKYFDTTPVASSMCVLKTGFLFVASEFGNHYNAEKWSKCQGLEGLRYPMFEGQCYLYQIAHLGDDDEEPEFSSAMPLEEGDTFFFAPRPLKNLVLVDELESLSPILNCQIADLAAEDTPQLYVACGRGPRSSMRILRHGLEVSEMAVSELPGNPNAVWTVKKKADDDFDAYIIVSFVNATLVLSIGETVEEVTDSGFLGTTPTLSCAQIGDDALVQIYPDGIRHIRADKRVNEWKTPGKKTIAKCAVNQRQVVIALTGGELVYFEMDPSGQINEYTDRKEMPSDVICMALASVPTGEQRSRFLALGLADNTVRMISLDPVDCLSQLSMQGLPAPPESLAIVEMGATGGGDVPQSSALYLNIGLQNGVLLRIVLDQVTGDLFDTRTRYLGNRAVKLFKVRMQSSDAVLAMSSRSWLSYYYQNRFHLTPLSYEALEYASGFSSEQCPEGIVAISANTLRILALEKLGAVFNQVSIPLEFTPRKFLIHQETGHIILIETDHNAYTEATKLQRKQQMAEMERFLIREGASDKQNQNENKEDKKIVKSTGNKRKYVEDYLKYGFIPSVNDPSLPFCLICQKTLSNETTVPSKLLRHIETNHREQMNNPISYFENIRSSFQKQSKKFKKFMTTSDEAQTASYMIAQLIARKKKAHAEAEEIILPALKIVAGCMLTNDAMEKVTKIPLSSKTIARRIEDMSEDIELQIKQSFNDSSTKWAIQLDETTDISNKAQLLAFLRFVDTGKIVNNYFFCKELKQRTTGADIFELVDENVMNYERFKKGIDSTCHKKNPNIKFVHCMIHREMLVSKSVPPILVTTLDEVVKVVNYIKSNALRSRIFSTFCEAMDSDYKKLLFHTEVRWLSKGKVLNRFISMKNEIMAFIDNEEINFPFMMSDVWWLRVSFLGDIFDKLNSLNLNLQGAQENIITISTKLKAFKEKLSLWNLNIAKENFASFPMVQENPSKSIIKKEVEETLTLLSASFDKYFPYLDVEKMEWEMVEAAGEEDQELAAEMAAAFLSENLPENTFGAPKAGPGMWASQIRVLEPGQGRTVLKLPLEQNEAALSLALVRFAIQGDEQFLLVGIAKDLHLNPRLCTSGCVNTYRILDDGARLELVHSTPVEDVPLAICSFQGRVLIGVGRILRIYDLGKKKLLRKCENKQVPNLITTIHSMGSRVVVGDVQDSFIYLRYKRAENLLVMFADDTTPRWVTCATLVDCNTVAGADKFGNITVIRIPTLISDEVDEDPTGVKALWDRGWLGGASQKAEVIANFHVEEVVLSLQKATLIPGGSESLVYTTLSGTVGVFVPFTSHEDHDFFQHLEMYMRAENLSLCGRDHTSFRSYHYPIKTQLFRIPGEGPLLRSINRNVIDGDLCEQFNSLEPAKQRSIAVELDRSPSEVSKKLENIRTRYAF
ncbi:SF3B3 [Cordylochernes scorpioides]|uniref:SF3B3 n=1 Tax=Cordylochernes scorpioides TaxID=51811 RepID=A0ABY6K5Z3_9ARAC|nr:SF3B3 [Cordylochernes scorpioides]